jgi:GT2 family glycosyltransferase
MAFSLTLEHPYKGFKMIFISIVSHGHLDFIQQNKYLLEINSIQGVCIIIRDNINDLALKKFCFSNNIHYINESPSMGFGANNNEVFKYVDNVLNVSEDDYFLIINPDVYIDADEFNKLTQKLSAGRYDFFTINLYKDNAFTVEDPFIRRFPSVIDFLQSFLFSKNKTIYMRNSNLSEFDWCAGSFMCFSVKNFRKLNGFDEGYFMYCEDIDICYRAKSKNILSTYFHDIKAIHLAQHTNRNIFSRHFLWHIKSLIRFILLKNIPKLSKSLGIKFNSRLS